MKFQLKILDAVCDFFVGYFAGLEDKALIGAVRDFQTIIHCRVRYEIKKTEE